MAMPGWKSLIVCDGIQNPCNFEDVILLIKNVIHDMVLLSTLVVVAALVYAGFLLLSSGGNPGALTQVKTMMWKIVVGYLWILAAWLIVYTISKVLLKDGFFFLLGAPKPN